MNHVWFRTALTIVLVAWAQMSVAQIALPTPETPFSGRVGRTFRDSGRPLLPQPVRAPQGAPNVVVILLDDVGFGQFSAFGGAVPSPAMEKLASNGVRFNRFQTAGICSPTRAALLTGRNSHNAGFGNLTELATGYDGYLGHIPNSTVTIAEILRQHGYATAMFGKNHNTPDWELGPAGPFNHWPTGLGFDYFYGFNAWGESEWQPALYENTRPVPPVRNPNYYLTTDLVDRSIAWMRTIKSVDPGKPFFLYLAPGATHTPHHAPQKWIEMFKGKFDTGWDRYREVTFGRQKKLGVIPETARLTPRPAFIPAWDSFSLEERKTLARQMEVFAGYGAYTDHEIGRMLDAIRELPDADNTLVIYIVGDNGANAEGGVDGEVNEIASENGLKASLPFTPQILAELGGPKYDNNFAAGWGWAMNTPFKYYKVLVSHLGAIRNPLIVSWPARIRPSTVMREQFHYVTDIMPTVLEAAGIEMPKFVNGIAQRPLDGVSMLYAMIDPKAAGRRTKQYFEMFGNRGIYDRGWFASALLFEDPMEPTKEGAADRLDPDKVTWELYNLDQDFTQADDISKKEPERLRHMRELWWAEAARNNVLPLDWRGWERFVDAQPPNPSKDRKQFVFYPGMIGLPEAIAPSMKNRSWSITARGEFGPKSEGMIITQGGMMGGWALYVLHGRLVFDYNYVEIWRRQIASTEPLSAGTTEIKASFDYDGHAGGAVGAGGTVTLWANGQKVGMGRLEKTVPRIFSASEGMDVGADYGSPVSDAYPFPFPFEGKLESVAVSLQ